MGWFMRMFARRKIYDDLSDEIEQHLAEKTDTLMAEGVSREEAERAAGDQMTLNVVDVGRRSEYALRYVGARLFCDRGPYSLIGGSRPLEPAVREE